LRTVKPREVIMTSVPSRQRGIGLREREAERPPNGSGPAFGRKVKPPLDGSPAGTGKADLPATENHLNAKR
jgi:hypothetical protein